MSAKKQILRRHTLSPAETGCVLTIGTFDGVHLGHRAILDEVGKQARERGMESVALTFEPTPNEYFAQGDPPARLHSWQEKITALFDAGIDQVVSLAFDENLRSLTAREFLQTILLDGLNAKVMIVGDDFHFGCDRKGNFEMLQSLSAELGFEVFPTPTVRVGGARVSSTRVRKLLAKGDCEATRELLGSFFAITGRVVHGEKLGRSLGYPTANIQLKRRKSPLSGVFVVRAESDGSTYDAVANIGYRPAVNSLEQPLLEVHLLDFEGDLYGKKLKIEFLHKLRDEMNFQGLDHLQSAIQGDLEKTRQFFANSSSELAKC